MAAKQYEPGSSRQRRHDCRLSQWYFPQWGMQSEGHAAAMHEQGHDGHGPVTKPLSCCPFAVRLA